jgi:predicted ATPase/DNA-binding winged helix-turn-helix (wHTH) protein
MIEQRRGVIFESGGWEVDLARREVRFRGTAVPMGARAFEVFAVLVQSAGELVTKDDLIERVWPGVIVEENTLQVHISAVRKVLGADRGLLKTTSGRGYRLLGTWTPQSESSATSPAAPEPAKIPTRPSPTNLPLAAFALIGRTSAMQFVHDLISAYRLVTLTGPGGIGKSALALEVARSLRASFPGGVWFVELASLTDPSLVPSAAASTIGLNLLGNETSPESVARAIGPMKVLLVLDSCEHVIDAVARLAEAIVRLCPDASLLSTSREALRIEGEHVYRVAPLDVPPPNQNESDAVLGHSAVQLFIARTKALDADCSEQGESLPAIAAICRRLDGIPLALEFAAARAATMGLPELLLGLDNRFGLLTAGRRTALPRHQTLRAALDWSYDLLTDSERRLLRRLGVFSGGFTLEAATSLMSDEGTPAAAITEGIGNLVAKSLVALDGSAGSRRWRLLETLHAYALEKLAASGETELSARRHAEFFRDFVLSTRSTPAPVDLALYGREIDNVRAALDWAFAPHGDPAIGVTLTAAYAPVWLQLRSMIECVERTQQALDWLERGVELSVALRAELNLQHGLALAFTMGSVTRAEFALRRALELAATLAHEERQLRALWGLWGLYFQNGECRSAQTAAEQFAAIAARAGHSATILFAERLLGAALHFAGDQRSTRHRFERVVAGYIAPQAERHTIWAEFNPPALAQALLARVLFLQGFADQAVQQSRTSLQQAQSKCSQLTQCEVLRLGVGSIALMSGDLDAAQAAVVTYLTTATAIGTPNYLLLAHGMEGRWLIKRGDCQRGLEILRDSFDACQRAGWTISYPELFAGIAEGLAGLGRIAEALATIDKALARADESGERWSVAEYFRMKGEFLLHHGSEESTAAAEVCFGKTLEVAREQGALFWELQGALSLARLRVRQGRRGEVRQVLVPVYDRFSEGFRTPPLRAARAIIDAT